MSVFSFVHKYLRLFFYILATLTDTFYKSIILKLLTILIQSFYHHSLPVWTIAKEILTAHGSLTSLETTYVISCQIVRLSMSHFVLVRRTKCDKDFDCSLIYKWSEVIISSFWSLFLLINTRYFYTQYCNEKIKRHWYFWVIKLNVQQR